MGARELKKAQTRRTIADVAVRLFTEHGYDDVTMAQVADEAGVSRRTAFRYFPSKDDLVLQYPAEWLAVFDATIETHRELPLGGRIRQGSRAVAAHIEADAVAVRQLFELAAAHPVLAGRSAADSAHWVRRLAEEIERERPDEAEARMLAAAVMGIINAACEVWAETDQPLGVLLERGLDLVFEPSGGEIGRS